MSGRVYRDSTDYGSGGLEEMTVNGVITEVRLSPTGRVMFSAMLLTTGSSVRGSAQSEEASKAVIANFGRPVAITGLFFVDGAGEPLFIEQVDEISPIDVVVAEPPAGHLRLRE